MRTSRMIEVPSPMTAMKRLGNRSQEESDWMFALRPSRGSAIRASGPSWQSNRTLPWKRAPTPADPSLVKGGLLGPRLLLGHSRQCTDVD